MSMRHSAATPGWQCLLKDFWGTCALLNLDGVGRGWSSATAHTYADVCWLLRMLMLTHAAVGRSWSSAAAPECENLAYVRACETQALKEAVRALNEAVSCTEIASRSPLFQGIWNACSQRGSPWPAAYFRAGERMLVVKRQCHMTSRSGKRQCHMTSRSRIACASTMYIIYMIYTYICICIYI